MLEPFQEDPRLRKEFCPVKIDNTRGVYTVPQFQSDLISAKTKADLKDIIRKLASQHGYFNNFGLDNWNKVFRK